MTWAGRRARRAALPAAVFLAVLAVHFVWLGFFPDEDPAQDRWARAPASERASWLSLYLDTGSYWLGFSYGISIAFAVAAFRRYREARASCARNLAVGGISFSGFLSVVGCYLLGCCGSPMLAVYLSLFGAAFLPFLKPLVAALTAATTLAAWWWLDRRLSRATPCGCEPAA